MNLVYAENPMIYETHECAYKVYFFVEGAPKMRLCKAKSNETSIFTRLEAVLTPRLNKM
jgi:hypothetical protein